LNLLDFPCKQIHDLTAKENFQFWISCAFIFRGFHVVKFIFLSVLFWRNKVEMIRWACR
jgi:hypothetical protein